MEDASESGFPSALFPVWAVGVGCGAQFLTIEAGFELLNGGKTGIERELLEGIGDERQSSAAREM